MEDVNTETKKEMAAWARWGVTVGIVVAVNFASASYYFGETNRAIQDNRRRIDALETNRVTTDQIEQIRLDLREVKSDVKDMLKQRK